MIRTLRLCTERLRATVASQRGSMLLKFALAMPVMMLSAGGGLDFALLMNARTNLQAAADAGALAAVNLLDASSEARIANGRTFFYANIRSTEHVTVDAPRISYANNIATVEATARINSSFLRLANITTLETSVTAQATAASGEPMELVVVIDTTNSMNVISYSFDIAKQELDLIAQNVLANNKPSEDPVAFFSVVPMSDRVNIGTSRSHWLKLSAPGGWNGCVEPRVDPHPHWPWRLTDDPPQNPRKFDPSIPGVTGGLASAGWGGPTCTAPIVGPTTSYATAKPAIAALYTSGTGRFDEGMAWGWRLLSKKWHGDWGISDYPNKNNKRRKILVFISDAYSEAMRYENDKLVGEPDPSWNTYSHNGFRHLVNMCDEMKKDNIEINMFFMNGNAKGKPYFEQCASSPKHFYDIKTVSDFRNSLETVTLNASPPRLIR